MYRTMLALCATALVLGAIACDGAVARACLLDQQPSIYADGRIARANTVAPSVAAELTTWSPFVFSSGYAVHHDIVLSENRRQVARVLAPAALRHPWRWRFGDGHSAVGWTVRHAYAHAGRWRIEVDAYIPGAGPKNWYTFDRVTISIYR